MSCPDGNHPLPKSEQTVHKSQGLTTQTAGNNISMLTAAAA
jgi:hypothetical protein